MLFVGILSSTTVVKRKKFAPLLLRGRRRTSSPFWFFLIIEHTLLRTALLANYDARLRLDLLLSRKCVVSGQRQYTGRLPMNDV